MSENWTPEERAAFYRQQDADRAAFDRMRTEQLRGNEAMAQHIREGWQPYRTLQRGLAHHVHEDRINESPPGVVN